MFKKRMKKALSLVTVMTMLMSLFSITGYADTIQTPLNQVVESQQDVVVNGNKVSISKSLEGTDIENVFDISLKVTTEEAIHTLYEDPDIAVAIVMDISGSMCLLPENNPGQQYKDAVTAAKNFIETYYADAVKADGTPKNAIRDLALISFNTNAKVQQGLTDCTDSSTNFDAAFANINNEVKYDGSSFDNNYRKLSHDRFTNIEGGLRLAQNVINQSRAENKFIILLTDGYPTTYYAGHNSSSTTSITGYDPYVSIGNIGDDGYFYDALTGEICEVGTSYSDKAALYAKNAADSIDSDDITIFTVGINIGGQNISEMQRTAPSVVDCFADNNSVGTFNYVEGTKKITNDTSTYVVGSNQGQYETWLKNNISTNSKYYSNGDTLDELNAAYTEFSNTIQSIVSAGAAAKWVVSDPMGKDVEFLQFFDKEGSLKDSLTGSSIENGENTAKYNNGISWDIKNSGYEITTIGNTIKYTYTLKYRVRLENEVQGFIENSEVETNGTTVLKYQLKETIDNSTKLVDQEDLVFPMPSVKGYLADLTFTKTAYDKALAGAEFTLSHDSDCSVCSAIGKTVSIKDMKATSTIAEGEEDAKVTFNNIPSGHIYTLKETKAPTGFVASNNEYKVTVSYDNLSVEKINADNTTTAVTTIDMDNKLGLSLNLYKVLNNSTLIDQQFTFELLDENKNVVSTAKNDANGNITFDIQLDKFAENYTFYVREVNDGQFGIIYDTTEYKVVITVISENDGYIFNTVYYADNETDPVEIASFTNTYVNPVDLTVQKVWSGSTTNPESILVQLYKNGQPYVNNDGNPAIVELRLAEKEVNVEEGATSEPTTVYPVGINWAYTWNDLDGAASWTVKELEVPSGYTVNYNTSKEDGTIIITNTKSTEHHPVKTFRTVKKVWNDNNNEANVRPDSVTVQLMKDGKAYRNTIVLNEANGWGYTWTSLPNGSKYEVVEVEVPDGYKVSVVNDTYYNFTVTNTYTGETKVPNEPIDPSDEDTPPVDNDKPSKDTNDKVINTEVPKTGDDTALVLPILGMILSIVGFYLLNRKKEEN